MTMAEAAKSIGAQGEQLAVVDVISQGTPILEEGHWEESNDFQTYHLLQTMTEAVGTDAIINQGVNWEVNTLRPVTEIIQSLESALKIDVRILRKQKNAEEYKRIQAELFLRGLSKSFHDRVFYGGTTIAPTTAVSPDEVMGLHTRFGTIANINYNLVQGVQYWPSNVVSAGGATGGGESSMWLIKWGKDGVFFPFPRDGQDFVNIEDMPEIQLVYDANNRPFRAEVTFFSIGFGLCVADWRCVQRLCNIDATHKWTSDAMVSLLAGLPDTDMSGVVCYVPRFVWVQMNLEAKNNANSFHYDDAPWGRKTVYFMDVPIRVCDRITQTEPVIS
jgi:hypothetical protein